MITTQEPHGVPAGTFSSIVARVVGVNGNLGANGVWFFIGPTAEPDFARKVTLLGPPPART